MQNNNICIEEDGISLKEFFSIIWKYKIFIFVFISIITSLSIVFALSKPNEYRVYTLLAPQEQSQNTNLGGLSALASMAGANIGGGNGITPGIAFKNLLNNYIFMKQFIIKNNIDKMYLSPNFDKNFIFAMNNRSIYDFFNLKKRKQVDFYTGIYLPISRMILISTNKFGLINVSVIGPNRKFNYYLLNHFLSDATIYLINKNLSNINSKIKKYQNELLKTNNLELKTELVQLIGNLIKQKVYINTSKYYKVSVVTDPYIPDSKAKIKPKRSFIVIGVFIASFIFSILIIFFIEFIKSIRE